MPAHRTSPAPASTHIAIRPMQPADLDAIVNLDALVFGQARPAYFERRIGWLSQAPSHDGAIGLVAETSDGVVGLVTGTLTSGEFGLPQITALVDSIAVHPAHRRHGIGRQLGDAFLAACAAEGAVEVHTLVNWSSWEMLKFFDALGFALASTISLHRRIG